LNKVDLLQKKLEQGIKFSSFLKTYTGPDECDSICRYMNKKFLSVYKEGQKKLKDEDRATSGRIVRVFQTSALDLVSTQQIIIQGAHLPYTLGHLLIHCAVQTSILHQNISSSKMV
jgi:hypothetical protein